MHSESIPTTNRTEVTAELELLEEPYREEFKLVGTDRETAARGAKVLQDRIDVGVWARSLGNMRAVMIEEGAIHPIDQWLWRIAALGDQCPFDHGQHASSDHAARVVVVQRGKPSPVRTRLSVEMRSGAVSINVPSRSKTIVSMAQCYKAGVLRQFVH